MPTLEGILDIKRCPHCNVDIPILDRRANFKTTSFNEKLLRFWVAYSCKRCGGAIIAASREERGLITEIYPKSTEVDENIPKPAIDYLIQAVDSICAPAGSVMLSASAIDAMLKIKGYTEGTLYNRIDKAVEDHLITKEMGEWAHDVRLDANDQRHADNDATLPSDSDARKCIDFSLALGQFLFVLPARVKRGLAEAKVKPETKRP